MKAVVFDFDGTLADTLPNCIQAFQYVFKTYDEKAYNDEEIKKMFGPSEQDIIRENLRSDHKEQAIEAYYETYTTHHKEYVEDNKEITELLSYLKDKGYVMGIVTGKGRRSLDISLDMLGMSEMFDVIVTGDDVDRVKPDPEGVHNALAGLKTTPAEAMFFGDSDADMEAGLEAGLITVGVQWLPHPQTKTYEYEPHYTLQSVQEGMQFFKEERFKQR
ncbi:HAD family hydrolase [Salsuginibacillus kocurii]|uniref:HAD family hydrolase n=1 Tax=Salsuginibacillus kocurii TaxID=427078 RepID=UPI00037D3E84|nr:HAD family hydrolase [Salsuginibacillus kocurii]